MQLITILLFLASVSAVVGNTLRGQDNNRLGERKLKRSKTTRDGGNKNKGDRKKRRKRKRDHSSSSSGSSSSSATSVTYIKYDPSDEGSDRTAWEFEPSQWGRRGNYCGNVGVTLNDLREETYDCADLIEDVIWRNFPDIHIFEGDGCYEDDSGMCISIDKRTICDNEYIGRRLADIESALPDCTSGRRRGAWRNEWSGGGSRSRGPW
mmetsp:Transcript_41449/g.74715  ORF Transcript_41449/g.74715 Transcript_41449/m.74715 type:complete len:208 (-) Transcript_41449:224-847(-)|eukprot:CAMPEP_0201936996 /NCGR_PEP_ID=MMETSP0903-20130614/38556_1 /ASSEMBLY_ACC=CAM_ASM_000552 /TAXON_ID=420261 /ORGANISM="Thalassiosira antarctica, Strain CCMP982" /LENGTH=207 /DNA_ID=CAMNT_0048477831 /DNA_START=132 /DNA_END=755 /DNA_ORIENTATION=-